MRWFQILLAILFMPVMASATEWWQVPVATCSDGTTSLVMRYYTLNGWLGSALAMAAVHLVCRKTRISKWRHVDVALAVTTAAAFVIAPLVVTYLVGRRFVNMYGGGEVLHHVMSWKGALGVVLFAGLFAYRLEVRAAAACVVGGVILAAGLLVGLPASRLEDPEPLVVVGHGVCDSDDSAYGF